MNTDAREKRARVERLTRELEQAQGEVKRMERTCTHTWDNPDGESKPIHHEGYRIAGDPPGTMGVDWRGPVDVPSRTIPRWVRTCTKCGFTEETREARKRTVVQGGAFADRQRRW